MAFAEKSVWGIEKRWRRGGPPAWVRQRHVFSPHPHPLHLQLLLVPALPPPLVLSSSFVPVVHGLRGRITGTTGGHKKSLRFGRSRSPSHSSFTVPAAMHSRTHAQWYLTKKSAACVCKNHARAVHRLLFAEAFVSDPVSDTGRPISPSSGPVVPFHARPLKKVFPALSSGGVLQVQAFLVLLRPDSVLDGPCVRRGRRRDAARRVRVRAFFLAERAVGRHSCLIFCDFFNIT